MVYIRILPELTGEPTEFQVKYRGPLVITTVLPHDVYRVTEIQSHDGHQYATSNHVSKLKGYHLPQDVTQHRHLMGKRMTVQDDCTGTVEFKENQRVEKEEVSDLVKKLVSGNTKDLTQTNSLQPCDSYK